MELTGTQKLTLSALTAALMTVLMLVGGVVPVAGVSIPAMAGYLLMPVVVEGGRKWGISVYLACGLLSLLLVSEKEPVLFYLLLFGYVPMVFAWFRRIRCKVLRLVAKLTCYSSVVGLTLYLSVSLLGIPVEQIAVLGDFTPPLLCLLEIIVCFFYDWSMGVWAAVYHRKYRRQLRRLFRRH